MTMSIFRHRSASGPSDSNRSAAARPGQGEVEPRTHSPSSTLGGLRRLENRLHKILPQSVTDRLLRRRASLPSTDGTTADATRGEAAAGFGAEGNHHAGRSTPVGPDLVVLAEAVEGFQDQETRYKEIVNILNKCETGCDTMNKKLADTTFRAIASLQDTPRDALLHRALGIVYRDPELSLSLQTLMDNRWCLDELMGIFNEVYASVSVAGDIPARAERLTTLVALLNEFRDDASIYDQALGMAIAAIGQTEDVESRSDALVELLAIVHGNQLDGPRKGRLMWTIDKLSGEAFKKAHYV